jgi:hypothetical protein
MYLGYDNGFPQGGMNDAGLAFDGFATGPFAMRQQDGKRLFPGNPINEVMETCATVEEVIAFLSDVDLRPLLSQAMLFFADASGDAVIVEGDVFLRMEGDVQAITNFYQSAQLDDRAQCPRYAAALDVLEGRPHTSIDICTEALSAAAQRGDRVASLYSNVFDLETCTARLYLFQDFENAVVLDLHEELKKGARTLRLPDLFGSNPAFERFVKVQDGVLAQRVADRRGPALDDAELEACTGQFDLTIGDDVHRITIARQGTQLLATGSLFARSDGSLLLESASPSEFFSMSYANEVTVRFQRDDRDGLSGLTLVTRGREYDAALVESD